ncbi:MAG: hypothetical protein ABR599_09715 [Gemmatimonadota bacterium]
MRRIACLFALTFVLVAGACADSRMLTAPEAASTRAALQDDGGVEDGSNN